MNTDFATSRKLEAGQAEEGCSCKAQWRGLARFHAAKVRNASAAFLQVSAALNFRLASLHHWAFLRSQNALTPAKPESARHRRASSVRHAVIALTLGSRRRVNALNLYRWKASVTQNRVAKAEPVTRKSAGSINCDG